MFWNKFKLAACLVLTAATFATGGTAWACHRFHLLGRPAPVTASPSYCQPVYPQCGERVQPLVCPPAAPAAQPPPPELPKVAATEPPPEMPEPQPPPKTLEPALKKVLDEYEMQRQKRECLIGKCSREEKSKATGNVITFEGEYRYLKPNFSEIQMFQKGRTDEFDLMVRNGDKFHFYWPENRSVVIFPVKSTKDLCFPVDLELPSGRWSTNRLPVFGPFNWILEMSANELSNRFDLILTKKNENYCYIEIEPLSQADRAVFKRAQIVLFTRTMLPRRLWIEAPSGDEITWEIPSIDDTTKLTPQAFEPPKAPAGWKIVNAPPQREEP
jgi:hypothetical protein